MLIQEDLRVQRTLDQHALFGLPCFCGKSSLAILVPVARYVKGSVPCSVWCSVGPLMFAFHRRRPHPTGSKIDVHARSMASNCSLAALGSGSPKAAARTICSSNDSKNAKSRLTSERGSNAEKYAPFLEAGMLPCARISRVRAFDSVVMRAPVATVESCPSSLQWSVDHFDWR